MVKQYLKLVFGIGLTFILMRGSIYEVRADQQAALSIDEFKKQFIESQVGLLPQDFSKKIPDHSKFDSKRANVAFEKFKDQKFDVNVYKVMAYNYYLRNRFNEADSVFKKLEPMITSDSDKFWLNYNWGITLITQAFIFTETEEYGELRRLINKALAAGYNFSVFLVSDFIVAAVKFGNAAKINPKSAEAYYYWGIAEIGIGQFKDAIEQFKIVIEINPNNADAYSQWGRILSNTGKYQEAIDKFQKALEIDPQDGTNYSNWGTALVRLERHEEAIEKYQKAVEFDPRNTFVYSNWGEALFTLERYAEATERCNKAIEIFSDNPDAYYVLAQIQAKLNLKQEALSYLQKACELNHQLKQIARNDKDFKKIWGDPGFRKITKP